MEPRPQCRLNGVGHVDATQVDRRSRLSAASGADRCDLGLSDVRRGPGRDHRSRSSTSGRGQGSCLRRNWRSSEPPSRQRRSLAYAHHLQRPPVASTPRPRRPRCWHGGCSPARSELDRAIWPAPYAGIADCNSAGSSQRMAFDFPFDDVLAAAVKALAIDPNLAARPRLPAPRPRWSAAAAPRRPRLSSRRWRSAPTATRPIIFLPRSAPASRRLSLASPSTSTAAGVLQRRRLWFADHTAQHLHALGRSSPRSNARRHRFVAKRAAQALRLPPERIPRLRKLGAVALAALRRAPPR